MKRTKIKKFFFVWVFYFFLFSLNSKSPSFEFYFQEDEILIVDKFQYVMNQNSEREEKNKIHLSVKEIQQEDGIYSFDGVFTTYTRILPKEKEFKKEEEYLSSFKIKKNGEYIVDEKYKYPNIQSLPTFPEIKNLDQIPPKWEKQGKEIINLLDMNLKIMIPFIVKYTYLGKETLHYYGQDVIVHKIQYEYELNHKVVPGNGPIKHIKGKTKGIIYFSTEMHIPLYDEQNLFYEFLLKNNQIFRETFFIKSWYRKAKKINKKELKEKFNPIQNENFTIRENERGISIDLNSILFDFDSYELKENSKQTLDQIIEVLKQYPNQEIQILGHTDNIGDENYNEELSEKRAKTVVEYLLQKGLSENQISYKGYGSKKPLYPNDSPENRAKNRRVEILIITD